MEKTMMLPAMYNVLSQEEMTYTEGGATMTQALLAALLPPYGWYKASTEIRDYRKKNPNTWLDTGLDAFVAGCEKNVTSAIYGIGCAYNFVAMNIATSGLGLIPAAYIIFKINISDHLAIFEIYTYINNYGVILYHLFFQKSSFTYCHYYYIRLF